MTRPRAAMTLLAAKVGRPRLASETWFWPRSNFRVPGHSTCRDGWNVNRRLACAVAILIFFTLPAHAQAPLVLKLSIHDTIQPITADYLKRGLDEAARQHAQAVLISLGTPGGLLASTRDMVAAIEASPVPVIIYIEPPGSRAGSAGFFLLEAADIAAMAPGTNAGAAHPIVEGTTMDPVLKLKIENDASAFLRSYTTVRGRNPTAAEDAVRNSKSYSETEAQQLKLIDLIAPNDAALLAVLDGQTIKRFDGSSNTLHLAHATILAMPPSLRERLLTRLTSPDLDVLFVVCGSLLIYLEFNVPGTIVPGALGTLLLLLGVFGLNLLPIRHTAILLLAAAFVLLVLEAKFASHGILAISGVLCMVFGFATLVDGPTSDMRVHLGTAIGAGVGFGTISFMLAWLAIRARRNKRLLGPQAMIGRTATALTPLAPGGQIEVRGEIWQAVVSGNSGEVAAGAQVTVLGVEGLTLTVSS